MAIVDPKAPRAASGADAASEADIVIVGGGHNGLTAAAYLARAGLSVLLLEQQDQVGGAAVSTFAFEGVDALLSRYSYLVSLLPQKIVDDLGLTVPLVRRRYSSYTPDPGDPTRGLLIDNDDPTATAAAFTRIKAPDGEAEAFSDFYAGCSLLTRGLWPTMTAPLMTRAEARALAMASGAGGIWEDIIERPLGDAIAGALGSDLVRGIALTDGLIGTFAQAGETDLQQNICFLYHLIGGGDGDWQVPLGGMGTVSGELERSATEAGALIRTGAEVIAIDSERRVTFRHHGVEQSAVADHLLINLAPAVLDRLSGGRLAREPANPNHEREGSQVKVNLLLTRLPRLLDENVSQEAAFGGTFHVNETYLQLQRAYEQAAAGVVPDPMPCEIYCHSLADPSILSPQLRKTGAQTLTIFGLHVPDRLATEEDNDLLRDQLQAAVFASVNSVLAEPIQDLLLRDATGTPCVETKTTLDIQRSVGMPRGNIFHGGLDWPFAEDDASMETAAQRWGVDTPDPRVLICGSGARRGGAVSGLGGHNAAMAVLELLGSSDVCEDPGGVPPGCVAHTSAGGACQEGTEGPRM